MKNNIPENPYNDIPYNWVPTPEQLLRFAISFCQEDLSTIRPGDLLNLREDLGCYMYGPPGSPSIPTTGGVMSFDDDTLTEAPVEKLIELQKEVYEILNLATSWNRQINPQSLLIKGQLPIHHISVGLDLRGEVIGVHGSSRDCFIFILYQLLVREPDAIKHIALCPGCGFIFYRIKRQKYCSQRCSNRMYMQEYRGKNSVETSEANHKQYEKRVKAKVGKSVKVGRRKKK